MTQTPGRDKVFCIGFHKTGTTSLAVALRSLGYSVTGPNGVDDHNIAENALPMALRLAEAYNAFRDNPWPVLYREMDERFPHSRFILTTRRTDSWIQSVMRHFGGVSTPMRTWIYGVGDPANNESVYKERYERHNREVRQYFLGRDKEFLELRVTDGEGWARLCQFLNHPVPEKLFPRLNVGAVAQK